MNTVQIQKESTTTQCAKLRYPAKVQTTGGREGGASLTSDGRLDVMLSPPCGPDEGTDFAFFAAAWPS